MFPNPHISTPKNTRRQKISETQSNYVKLLCFKGNYRLEIISERQ
jgi:hypothetical protein